MRAYGEYYGIQNAGPRSAAVDEASAYEAQSDTHATGAPEADP